MSTVYVAMICDRHADPEPYVFSSGAAAIEYARKKAHDGAHKPEDVEETPIPGWLYYAAYSSEGDAVWVVEKEVDGHER